MRGWRSGAHEAGERLIRHAVRRQVHIDWRGKLVWSPRYQRLSQRTQRSTAQGHEGKEFARVVPGRVCWHGHRDFFRALYKLAPRAVVRTAMAVYRDAEDFEAHFESTRRQLGGESWVGMMKPYADACTCSEGKRTLLTVGSEKFELKTSPRCLFIPR